MKKHVLTALLISFNFTNVFTQQITKSLDTVIATDFPSTINRKTIRLTNTLGGIYLRMFMVDSSYRPNVDSISGPVTINGSTSSPICGGVMISFDRNVWNGMNCTQFMGSGNFIELSNFRVYTALPLPKTADIRDEDTVVIPINAYYTQTSTEPVFGNPVVVKFYMKGPYNVYPGDIHMLINNNQKSKKAYYDLNGKVRKNTVGKKLKAENRHLVTRPKR